MINAADLYSHKLLTDAFGRSKCYQAAQFLRDLDAYPKRRSLTIREAATYLYCLCATEDTNVEKNTKRAAEELPLIDDARGETFINHLERLLKEERLIAAISEVGMNIKKPLCWIRENGGIINVYQAYDNMIFPYSRVHVLYPQFLKAFASVIKERALNFEYQN